MKQLLLFHKVWEYKRVKIMPALHENIIQNNRMLCYIIFFSSARRAPPFLMSFVAEQSCWNLMQNAMQVFIKYLEWKKELLLSWENSLLGEKIAILIKLYNMCRVCFESFFIVETGCRSQCWYDGRYHCPFKARMEHRLWSHCTAPTNKEKKFMLAFITNTYLFFLKKTEFSYFIDVNK